MSPQSEHDLSVYFRENNGLWDRIATHSDDMIICSMNVEEIVEELSKVYELKVEKNLSKYLGADFEEGENGRY